MRRDGNETKLFLTHHDIESCEYNNPDFAKENFKAGWNDI
jgi:hypothetical protein